MENITLNTIISLNLHFEGSRLIVKASSFMVLNDFEIAKQNNYRS